MNRHNPIAMAGVALVLSGIASPCLAQRSQLGPSSWVKPPTTQAEIEAGKPNPQAPGFRVPFPPLDQMEPAQRADFERQSRGFNTPVGNRVPLMLTPELDASWQGMSSAVQRVTIPNDVYELTIIMVGAYWRAGFEWWAHAPLAVTAGVPAEAVEAIRLGKTPKLANARQQAAYDLMQEFLTTHRISDAAYERMRAIIGAKGMVEMITTAGWYSNISMSIVAHGIPLRSDVPPPFPDK